VPVAFPSLTLTAVATAAALDLGAIDQGEGLTSTQIANALISANQMLAQWSIDQRFIVADLFEQNMALTANVQKYSIGFDTSGAPNLAFGLTRPIAITAASVNITATGIAAFAATGDPQYAISAAGAIDSRPLTILTAEAFAAMPNKDVSSVFPKGIFYDRENLINTSSTGFYGNVWIVPTPLGGTVDIHAWAPINGFVNATTPLILQDASYAELIEYGLALRMSAQFPGMPIPEWVKVGYAAAERRVMTLNGQILGSDGDQPATTQTPSGPPSGPPPPHA
jgi:hypothetical protein